MSEYKTLDQWFPNGRGDKRKFTSAQWDNETWVEPIFKSRESLRYKETWHCLDEKDEEYPIFDQDLQLIFKEWHQPKKRVTKYLWYNTKENSLLKYFATNKENLFYQIQCAAPNTFLNHESYYIRLDWSATEFDDE